MILKTFCLSLLMAYYPLFCYCQDYMCLEHPTVQLQEINLKKPSASGWGISDCDQRFPITDHEQVGNSNEVYYLCTECLTKTPKYIVDDNVKINPAPLYCHCNPGILVRLNPENPWVVEFFINSKDKRSILGFLSSHTGQCSSTVEQPLDMLFQHMRIEGDRVQGCNKDDETSAAISEIVQAAAIDSKLKTVDVQKKVWAVCMLNKKTISSDKYKYLDELSAKMLYKGIDDPLGFFFI